MLILTFLGIALNLAYNRFPRIDPTLGHLVLAFALAHTFSLISAYGFWRELFGNERVFVSYFRFGNEHVLIPYLYLAYFLGISADGRFLSKWIPYIFVSSIFFIFVTTLVDIFKEYNPIFRFGYRNIFFSPTILTISLYLMYDDKNLLRRIIYTLAVFLSVTLIILHGYRTSYLMVAVSVLLLIAYRWYKGQNALAQALLVLLSFAFALALGLSLGYLMFGRPFLLFVFSRFSSILSTQVFIIDPSAQVRSYDISLAVGRFLLSPMFGRTEMDFLIRWIEGVWIFFIDNSFLNVLWKKGIFGLVIYVTMLAYALYVVIKGVLNKNDFAFFTFLLFSSLLILSFASSSLIYYIHIAVLMICVGVLSRMLSEIPHQKS